MKEIWKPINPTFDIENCYEVSNLGRIKNIKYNKIQDNIHHSTNGFDYIFIATKDHKPSYQHIDEIVCATFYNGNINNIECGKPIIPYHKDGNTRNNEASNLEFIEDIEKWKPVVYKDIIPDRYMISNWGNVFDNVLKCRKSISCNNKYYPASKFMTIDGRYIKYDIHRIVATIFIPGCDDEHNVVNHIDNTYNNHWRNLEWCTVGWNNSHSTIINQTRGILSIDDLDKIRDMLIEYKSPRTVYQLLDHEKFPNITETQINDIKRCNSNNRNDYMCSWKYTVKELKSFMNDNRIHQWYTIDDIEYFCQIILKNNCNINDAYSELIDEGYKIIRCTLYSLLKMRIYKEITVKYFKHGD